MRSRENARGRERQGLECLSLGFNVVVRRRVVRAELDCVLLVVVLLRLRLVRSRERLHLSRGKRKLV